MSAPVAKGRAATGRTASLAEWLAAKTGRGLVHLALMVIGLLWLVPTFGLVITSFRPRPDIASSGWWTVFSSLHLTAVNYQEVLTGKGMGHSFLNSILITVPSTVLPVLIGAAASYGFAWLHFPGRDGLFLAVVALMMVPIQMALVPVLRLFNAFGLTQSLLGIWLAHTAFGLPFAIFLLRNFFITLPGELLEAARIDGASNVTIFFRLILPLSVPVLASLTIFQFLWVWNDLLMALVFIQNPNFKPLTAHISSLLSTYGSEWHLLSAGAFLIMSVPLVVFFALQRYFVQGLLAGSVK